MTNNYRGLYDNNADFRAYVDGWCGRHGLTVDDVLKIKLVQNYADWFIKAQGDDLGDYPDVIPNQFDNMTGSMNC